MVILLNQILKSSVDAKLMLKACAFPHLEDISQFVEIPISSFINIQSFPMLLLEMDLDQFGPLSMHHRTYLLSRVKITRLRSTRICRNSMHLMLVSKLNKFLEEFFSELKAKNSLHFMIGKPKFSSGELMCLHLPKMCFGVKMDNKSFQPLKTISIFLRSIAIKLLLTLRRKSPLILSKNQWRTKTMMVLKMRSNSKMNFKM